VYYPETEDTNWLKVSPNGNEFKKFVRFLEPIKIGGAGSSPGAWVHITGGTSGVGKAPLKFTAGTNLTTPEAGAVEFDGTHLYVTIGSTRYQLDQQSAGSGATTALDNLASVAINASLLPGTSDAVALGSTTKQWSDLFIAEGAVINWDNGDVTITQTGNVLSFAGASTRYEFDAAVAPTSSDGAALGTTALQWSDIFLAEGGVINFDNGDVTITQVSDVLTVAGGDLKVTTPGNASTSVLTTDGTQTQTNKRITKRTGTTASSATPTINTDNVDRYYITALATNITSMTTNLSGTPVLGDQICIWFKDDGTPRTITWGASFGNGAVTLPTTTTASTDLCVCLERNPGNTLWVAQAKSY